MDLGITGRVALVTGGRTGLGYASAIALAREGVDVAICSRDAAQLEQAASAIAAETGRRAIAVSADLSQPDAAERAVAETVERLGQLDILVNSAGAARLGNPLELDDAAWTEALNLKFLGYVRAGRAAAPRMIERGWGRIVNIIGAGGHQASPLHLPGGASNAALVLFTKGFALEMVQHGVLVNAVSPTAVATSRLERLAAANAERWGIAAADAKTRMAENHPMKRFATPEEVADTVCFLASERASYYAGTTVLMDGGEVAAI